MAEKNETKKNERPVTRIPELLDKTEIQDFIQSYYKKEGKASYPSIAMLRWRKGTHYPPVRVLIGIAKILKTNLTYILGLTNESVACDYDKEPAERTLHDLEIASGMSKKDLVHALNNNYKTVYRYEAELPRRSVYSLIMLARAMNLSVDYILGYTDWVNWELWAQVGKSFSVIKPGTPAYVVADKNIQSAEDMQRAISRGDGQYCLLTADGRYVLFPNGNKFRVDDEMFLGVYVTGVVPEVST